MQGQSAENACVDSAHRSPRRSQAAAPTTQTAAPPARQELPLPPLLARRQRGARHPPSRRPHRPCPTPPLLQQAAADEQGGHEPHVRAVILAGGETKNPLTRHRAMPAVPLGSSLLTVDVPLNNCLQAGINKMWVAGEGCAGGGADRVGGAMGWRHDLMLRRSSLACCPATSAVLPCRSPLLCGGIASSCTSVQTQGPALWLC